MARRKPLLYLMLLLMTFVSITGCTPRPPQEIMAPNPGKIEDHEVLKLTGTMRTDSEEWHSSSEPNVQKIEFDLTQFRWAKRVTLGVMLRTADEETAAMAELYNFTDNKPISGSQLQANCRCFRFVETGDLIEHLPRKKIVLGLRIRTEKEGVLVTNNYNSYLTVFNR